MARLFACTAGGHKEDRKIQDTLGGYIRMSKLKGELLVG
jgi:hypothetical protein